jgi:hypothetical protein
MSTFDVTVNHDNGSFVLSLTATSEEAARVIVCKVEGCPPSAIESCNLVK